MSLKVLDEVLDHSRSRGTDRNVLVAIAEYAWKDGVTWRLVGESPDDDGTICKRANCSKREALRAIKSLREDLHELETRKVRRGRSYVTVYRVVVGSIAQAEVEYSRLPFDLNEPFLHGDDLARWRVGLLASPDTDPISDGPLVQGDDLASSTGAFTVPDPAGSGCHDEPVHGDSGGPFKVTPTRAREKYEPEVENQQPEPSLEPSAGQDLEGRGDHLAAGEPSAAEREIVARVRALRGADADSPNRILPLALQLPASVFLGAVASVEAARASNPCGLLTHRLKIAVAERRATAQADFMAMMATTPSAPAPWGVESLKRDAPARYVRLLAHELDDAELADVLSGYHAPDRIAELLELAAAVRAGTEPALEPETPEQARARWVADKAADTGFPLGDLQAVIAAWDDVADIEREALIEHAETARAAALDQQREAAA